ncbi:Uncharacterised protein [uncultured archaeon]|nr:Uncharacterised protein [uncultured archaeon]
MVEIGGIDLSEKQVAFIGIFLIGGLFAPWYGTAIVKPFFDMLPGLPLRPLFEFILNGLVGDLIGITIWEFILGLIHSK